jgi:predicted Zn-dependent protease with MMP-like domain
MNEPLPDAAFEEMVLRALEELPREFREQLTNLAVIVEDEPPDGQPLLGLYQGVPLTRQSVFHAWSYPHKITIFRGPLLRLCRGEHACLEREVRRVVRHEVAHYFGISDRRLIEIDRY